MLKELIKRCIDINSSYCPCLLADTNHCVYCSQLQGKEFCDCDWQGVCILYENFWQKKCIATNKISRVEEKTQFSIKEKLNEKTYIIEFTVSQELAERLDEVGAFVFLRNAEDEGCCCFPVGVMAVQKNIITVAVEIVGAKSARLFINDGNILVRGPYYNGMLGKPWIDNIKESNILLVAGGIGQAPASSVIHKLVENNNMITAILAPGKVGKIFVGEKLRKQGVLVYDVDSLRKTGFVLLKELLNDRKIDLVISAGPDSQHRGLINGLNDYGYNIPMAVTNNATMCCGEGICGSCQQMNHDNQMMKLCKMQVDFNQIMQN
ncbi:MULTISPECIES: hypothetical protein [Anaerosinus]|uniref:Sulfide/dihydroorotate dehydrogenase-like FAD/NAD-binding protein n=1 Tax=Selenobaculum gibii TaxID=3054208 RepID=A0A9Y2EUS6_9FIRM|nr:hypothetical protein [Selenobaculum gbiensis]WIW69634.1 hypothetical protein P3F81_06805 [Selenobaculum gbiensis]